MSLPDLLVYGFFGFITVLLIFGLLDRAGKIPATTADQNLAELIADLRESREHARREAEEDGVEDFSSVDPPLLDRTHSYALEPDDADDRVWKSAIPRPRGAWKIWARTSVAGTRHHATAVERFLIRSMRADPTRVGLDLQTDPENPHDPNAIRVYGYVDGARFHLGHVPAELAAEIAEKAPPDMPISAHLQRVFCGDRVTDLVFHLLVPAQRNEFWQGRRNPFASPTGARAVWTGPVLQSRDRDDDDA